MVRRCHLLCTHTNKLYKPDSSREETQNENLQKKYLTLPKMNETAQTEWRCGKKLRLLQTQCRQSSRFGGCRRAINS